MIAHMHLAHTFHDKKGATIRIWNTVTIPKSHNVIATIKCLYWSKNPLICVGGGDG